MKQCIVGGILYIIISLLSIQSIAQPVGVTKTLAGSGAPGSADGMGPAASFNLPFGITVTMSGDVYVADARNNKVRRIAAGGVVSTYAGSGSPGDVDGIGTAASFNFPVGVAVDASGILYVGDNRNHKIRKILSLFL